MPTSWNGYEFDFHFALRFHLMVGFDHLTGNQTSPSNYETHPVAFFVSPLKQRFSIFYVRLPEKETTSFDTSAKINKYITIT